MIIFPAIDIKEGKCVRLLKGDFNQLKEYEKSPLEQAKVFINFGFYNLHIVDLDGALKGKSFSKEIIKEISRLNRANIQVGGGIRTLDQINELLDVGVDKIILGTRAIEDKDFLEIACKKFKDKIVLSIDTKNGFIALSGWTKKTNIRATDFIDEIKDLSISRIIYTDIEKDGTKTGPNLKETLSLSNLTKIPIVVSGGISSIKDVLNIKNKKFKNIEGVIIGKAIYDGNINLKELSKLI
ncbi:MAG: 1-(5-phosphoribosyl)-5-[(5-phosphoribosylamino)methylideneamino]imidazole-4-carboxamide isomerase [Candidatus Marinimicrobia bacterium]|nr:1-(5-phosphoribosyl)-5-[(5-phosphoribosylamino)methylideneamino]imidazole-4-carboxamide isomerase [Candidatus Neomarinimicrobiota bacterium]RPG06024.1 MAG: 1-(5-phosphoribosyl)-5-[(5-phosphoribosylamino)methylideneamino]imidazole-4-carboxamide isomerase [Pelagibacteraceae bacterium TMED247]|tara:strand:+ start:8159 stop:8878 length:720 start_codon:yes stop_codon:yes gene_type:complete